jgi:hypothetical protein
VDSTSHLHTLYCKQFVRLRVLIKTHISVRYRRGKGGGDERRKKREMKKKTWKMRAMKGGGESARTSGLAPHFFISCLLYQDQEE